MSPLTRICAPNVFKSLVSTVFVFTNSSKRRMNCCTPSSMELASRRCIEPEGTDKKLRLGLRINGRANRLGVDRSQSTCQGTSRFTGGGRQARTPWREIKSDAACFDCTLNESPAGHELVFGADSSRKVKSQSWLILCAGIRHEMTV